MAKFDVTKTIVPISITPLHTSVAKRCTVEILEVIDGDAAIVLSRKKNGAIIDGPFFQTFIGLTLGQTIPFGVIRASIQPGDQATTIRYRVRTGADVTGTPEGPTQQFLNRAPRQVP
jgi:hypothetical protein